MPTISTGPITSEEFRREVFAALGDRFGPDSSPHQSRLEVAREYGLSYAQVAEIEHEGIEGDWEP